ncbi:helix-turn-helix transcriptional regulator [Sporosarcina sp. ANT_H38]|uniref:helix-turn-helix domain-containing protein n=1 Tax=Sporosarcina sp. ANT_H38 TaxID=2597358 RepID=UPI0011F3D82D|nr:helix-turn-helix transcriptional regulator [Sporosarcina sp. ANT_H38]KAA0944118.1 helix-turn-helix transcriptional regulator [Sporosarcina sp. ANT_H38]
MEFKDRLISLRKDTNLLQVDMAKKIGVARATYGAYEQGTRQPDFEILQRIADFFEVPTDYLLGRSNAKSNPEKELSKDEKDIAKRIKKIKKNLLEGNDDGGGLNYMGEPMSDEAIESLLEALEHAERIATLANKKYTPKKYKG